MISNVFIVYWLSYAVMRMICLTAGQTWFYDQRRSYANSLQVCRQSLKSFEELNLLGWKFLTITLTSKDIEQGLKSPMESSAIGSWLRICLLESKDRIVLSTKPGFRGVRRMTLICLVPDKLTLNVRKKKKC